MVSRYINNFKNLNFNKFLHCCNREKCIVVNESHCIISYLQSSKTVYNNIKLEFFFIKTMLSIFVYQNTVTVFVFENDR